MVCHRAPSPCPLPKRVPPPSPTGGRAGDEGLRRQFNEGKMSYATLLNHLFAPCRAGRLYFCMPNQFGRNTYNKLCISCNKSSGNAQQRSTAVSLINITKQEADESTSEAVPMRVNFEDISRRKCIFIYAGDIPQDSRYDKYIGLSLSQSDSRHLQHDVTETLPLPDGCVDVYQSEDVFEHIDHRKLQSVINDIYRVLKPGGLFRLSLPDYRCNILYERSLKDEYHNVIFDPGGGGGFICGKVVNGGHVWFPKYETVRGILYSTQFTNITFYHYYDEEGNGVTSAIDYSLGHVMRTPDHDERVQNPYRPMSIVVDCLK